MNGAPSILYIGYWKREFRSHRFDGIRRYAQALGWEVVPVYSREVPDAAALRARLERTRPVGAVVESDHNGRVFRPREFGVLPTVWFDPPDRAAWRGVARVACDEAAVARAAFEELSAGLPPACGLVTAPPEAGTARWARERAAAFLALCRADGKRCLVFSGRAGEASAARAERLAAWCAALPCGCAVFAVDDYRAAEAAHAFAAAHRPLPHSATLVGANGAGEIAGGPERGRVSSVRIDFELSGYLAAKRIGETVAHERSFAAKDAKGAKSGAGAPSAASYGPLLVERGASTRGRGRREAWILEAVETIRREACDGLSAADVVKRSGVSKSLFNLRFREAMGHSALDEILHVRMERVFSLIDQTDLPLGVLSDMCGFGSHVELRQLFRARTGTSMTEWRRQRR